MTQPSPPSRSGHSPIGWAQVGAVRSRVLVADLLVLAWCLLWWRLAVDLRDWIVSLGAPGQDAVSAGDRFTGTLNSAGNAANKVPLVGSTLADPLRDAAGAGTQLANAGRTYQGAVDDVAHGAYWTVLALAVGLVLLRYLWWRQVRLRTVAAARRLRSRPDGLALLGLRAAATAPLGSVERATRGLASAGASTVTQQALEQLGLLELARLGLAPPRAPGGPAGARVP